MLILYIEDKKVLKTTARHFTSKEEHSEDDRTTFHSQCETQTTAKHVTANLNTVKTTSKRLKGH